MKLRSHPSEFNDVTNWTDDAEKRSENNDDKVDNMDIDPESAFAKSAVQTPQKRHNKPVPTIPSPPSTTKTNFFSKVPDDEEDGYTTITKEGPKKAKSDALSQRQQSEKAWTDCCKSGCKMSS